MRLIAIMYSTVLPFLTVGLGPHFRQIINQKINCVSNHKQLLRTGEKCNADHNKLDEKFQTEQPGNFVKLFYIAVWQLPKTPNLNPGSETWSIFVSLNTLPQVSGNYLGSCFLWHKQLLTFVMTILVDSSYIFWYYHPVIRSCSYAGSFLFHLTYS